MKNIPLNFHATIGLCLFLFICSCSSDDNFDVVDNGNTDNPTVVDNNGNNDPDPVNILDDRGLPGSALHPSDNPNSQAKIELGRLLFYDPILSGEQDVSCATCHHPAFGYSDGRDLPIGVGGIGLGPARFDAVNDDIGLVPRNSPTGKRPRFNGRAVKSAFRNGTQRINRCRYSSKPGSP